MAVLVTVLNLLGGIRVDGDVEQEYHMICHRDVCTPSVMVLEEGIRNSGVRNVSMKA